MLKLVHGSWFMVHGNHRKSTNHQPLTTNQTGFTLVELITVIAIIAILSSIGLISYREVQENARDAKRQTDLRTIQSALEQYHNDQHYYPQTASPGASLSFGTRTYLNQIPVDPLNSSPHTYCYKALLSTSSCELADITNCDNSSPATHCSQYCLYARLENGPANLTDVCSGASSRNFRVTPP